MAESREFCEKEQLYNYRYDIIEQSNEEKKKETKLIINYKKNPNIITKNSNISIFFFFLVKNIVKLIVLFLRVKYDWLWIFS